MTDKEAEQVLEVLSGGRVHRCQVCDEAIPWWPSMIDGPRWSHVHEPVDGYPDCFSVWSERVSEARRRAQSALWNGGKGYIAPTKKQLARARAVKL